MIGLILVALISAVFKIAIGGNHVPFESTASFKKDLFSDQSRTRSTPPTYSTVTATPYITGFPSWAYIDPVMNISGESRLDDLIFFDVQAPVKTMVTFCQITQSCQKESVTYEFEQGGKCCLPCDCSDGCYTTGTCCAAMTNGSRHHYYPNPPSQKIEETCVETFINGDYFKSHNNSYLLFQKCTTDNDIQTERKCLYPDVSKLDEMTPVLNRKTNQHYRNIFCSKCNMETDDVIFWNIRVSCNSSGILLSGFPKLPSVDKFWISKFRSANPSCTLIWDPPSNEKEVDRCLSEQTLISDCNKPILDTLCKQYYAPVRAGNHIYRNLFCMECAKSSNFTGLYNECFPFPFGFEEEPFISLLSLSIDEEIPESTISEINICPSPKRYNDKLGTCIHQTCAVTEMNVADVCKPVFSQLKNVHLEYRIKLLYHELTPDMMDNFPLMIFNNDLFAVLGIRRSAANMCFGDILGVTITPYFAEVRAVIFKSVQTTNIQQSYNEYEQNIESYNKIAKEKKKMFLLQIDKSDIEPVDEDVVTFVKFARSKFSHDCMNTIAMSKLQFCDIVTFHDDQFQIYGNGTVSIDDILFSPGEFVLRQTLNGSIKYVQVCLDDYISTHKFIKEGYRVTAAGEYGRVSGILFLLQAVIALNYF